MKNLNLTTLMFAVIIFMVSACGNGPSDDPNTVDGDIDNTEETDNITDGDIDLIDDEEDTVVQCSVATLQNCNTQESCEANQGRWLQISDVVFFCIANNCIENIKNCNKEECEIVSQYWWLPENECHRVSDFSRPYLFMVGTWYYVSGDQADIGSSVPLYEWHFNVKGDYWDENIQAFQPPNNLAPETAKLYIQQGATDGEIVIFNESETVNGVCYRATNACEYEVCKNNRPCYDVRLEKR